MLEDLERDIDKDWNLSVYDNFFILVDGLIELNKRMRIKNVNLYNIIGLKYYLKEYCTVKIDVGRQSGKSEYIAKNSTNNDLIITFNINMKKIFTDIKHVNIPDKNIISIQSLYNKKEEYGGRTYNNIWMDEASFISKNNNIDFLYDVLGKNENQTFIFLG